MVQKRSPKNGRKMVPETAPYDSAEFLNSRKAVEFYMEEAMESGDARLIARAAAVVARAKTMNQAAKKKRSVV
jgi:probable addiction module antidote protein